MPRHSVAALAVVAVLAGCGGGSVANHPPAAYRGGSIPATTAPSFTLTDQQGRAITMAQWRGDWTIVTFLYTHCPDVCPVIANKLNAVLRLPVARRAHLHVLAVSVDPARDTPAAVRQYVHERALLPSFHYLIGAHAQLAHVWRAYHVAVLPGAKGTITHQALEILVDPKGQERLIYDNANLAHLTDDVVHDLDALHAA